MKKILILTDFSSGFSRNLLKGIVNYAKGCNDWSFYRMPSYYRELHGDTGVVKWAKKWGANAIIAQFIDIDISTLGSLKIPIIVQNYRTRHPSLSNITGDYFNTGEMAAEFFISKGFNHYAYYGYNNTVWMRERKNGYISKLKENNYDVLVYTEESEPENGWNFNHTILKKWLNSLPKPVAMFACDDAHALHITELCKMTGIEVPDEISVLGVDNDELLCNISDPKLSSIELDVDNGGYMIGKLLHDYFETTTTPPTDIRIKPLRIVSRESTEKFVLSNKHIEKIIDYINENHMENISVEEIISVVPSSRRVLEKLFKKDTGTTIYKYLQSVRIEKFAHLLITTNLPLVDAALYAGFFDYKNVSRVFLKAKKMTPYQYRKLYTKTTS